MKLLSGAKQGSLLRVLEKQVTYPSKVFNYEESSVLAKNSSVILLSGQDELYAKCLTQLGIRWVSTHFLMLELT